MALETFDFRVNFTGISAAGTTVYTPIEEPTNGLTLIASIRRNTIIKKVQAYTFSRQGRNLAATGSFNQANFWQMEFEIVDLAGQRVNNPGGFANLFVPDPNISVQGLAQTRQAVNQTMPIMEMCAFGCGIYIPRFTYQLQSQGTSPFNTELFISVTYEK